MSRKYVRGRCSVTCGRLTASPYLVRHFDVFTASLRPAHMVVDLGCGNGRNSRYMTKQGCLNVRSFDMAADFGSQLNLGVDALPISDGQAQAILANYTLMFLQPAEITQLLAEINRIAALRCRLMVELYPSKHSRFETPVVLERFKIELIAELEARNWRLVHGSKHKFIMEKTNGK